MQPLEKSLRNNLERTIKEARDIAEKAARVALEQLGVGESKAYLHLSDDERKLRRRLRAHGRQLGNGRNTKGEQELDRLIEEVAYEHWHRMLFARFLAENDLLMYVESTKDTKNTNENQKDFSSISCGSCGSCGSWTDAVPVTLEECEDLAADEGAANGWELAARFAARMLPQIFRLDSPVFQLGLPPEHQQKLERLVADLPLEVFTASDSLGWVYQFWQSKKKDEVNASEVKIGARELPAVTQLFTEPYMVSFLLDNSLGAWWAARRLSTKDIEEVSTKYTNDTNDTKKIEEELRRRVSIPGVQLEYLRFIKEEDVHEKRETHEKEEKNLSCLSCGSWTKNSWVPAAGTFDGWPEQLADLKTLDPCCGSGHFLVAAFLMLVPMRMELEGLSAKEAVNAVLRDNIHGLELDQRCVELAAFALALTAWKYPNAGGYRVLPELNVACSGLSISAKKEDWLALAGGNTNLRVALEELYKQFKDAPVLGSLINPEASLVKGSLFELKWEEVGPLLTKALAGEKNDELSEMGVTAQKLSKSASILADRYNWIVTNVPYLAWGKQTEILKTFTGKKYPIAKKDLANVFLERIQDQAAKNAVIQVVTPQNWLFLTSYKTQRIKLLKGNVILLVAMLGGGAFESISGEVVKAILITIVKQAPTVSTFIKGIDLSNSANVSEKRVLAKNSDILSIAQSKVLEAPDSRILLSDTGASELLDSFTYSAQGIGTTDNARFVQSYWEQLSHSKEWETFQTSCKSQSNSLISGYSSMFRWGGPGMDYFNHIDALKKENRIGGGWQAGGIAWGRKGVAINVTGRKHIALYSKGKFDTTTGVVIPKGENTLPQIAAYLLSHEFEEQISLIDPTLSVTEGTLIKVPFDLVHWTKVAAEKYPNGLPKPYTDDPTQWIFHGHPCGSVIWDGNKKSTGHGPLRTDDTVLHVAVARLLGYRWPAELESTKDTKSTKNEFELCEEAWFWVRQCEELLPFADEDGIVCIPPVRGEPSAADRLLNLLAKAHSQYSSFSNSSCLSCLSWTDLLLKSADHAGKTLETWLREKFFTQHCKLFQHRPFIWHIWDGLRDGFSALVNYHKLDAKLLETFIYNYLGDWISRQRQDVDSGVDGAQERLAAAEALKKKLELIIEGEKPYDIFVRWKPIEKQPIGWNPDLNDGVRINIRPFMTVGDVKTKGAGVLRNKPNIKWGKDRGKDVTSAPWYHLFKGDRINDHHLTLKEKLEAHKK